MQNNFTREDCEIQIKELTGLPMGEPLPRSIERQINRFLLEDEMTYKEIAQCLFYYTEIIGKRVDPVYGIFFIPNVRHETKKYFIQLKKEKEEKEREAKKFTEQEGVMVINIKNVARSKTRKKETLSFDDIKIEDGEDDGDN